MIKRLLLIPLLLIFVCAGLNAQVTIFAEDFEAASGVENIVSPYLGWQNGFFPTNPTTDNNFFWVLDNTRCNVISGTHSMAVSVDPPATSGALPEYETNRRARTLAYYTTPIDATNYTNLTLDFNWICEGEAGQDYGYVLYSLDANFWSTLPGTYESQNTIQNVTNLDLSVLDGQVFYIAFGWDNDNNGGTYPGFIVDDIEINGTAIPTCTTPNQPTALVLNSTNNSIVGSFTAATPNPDNYLVVVSTNPTAPTPVDGTTYNIGDNIGTGTVVDIDANTDFTAAGLTQNTTYYIFVYSYNSLCSSGPEYNETNPLSGSDTTTNSNYCNPLTANTASTRYIDGVEFLGTLNDVSNLNNGFSNAPSGYQDFTTQTNSIQGQGAGINVYIESNNNNGHWKAWVDWNNDGTFNNDASETVYDSGNVVTATTTFGFVIPAGQAIGDYRIRVRFQDSNNTTNLFNDFDACETFDTTLNLATNNPNDTIDVYGEAEDYLFTVVESCVAQITSITESSACGPGSTTLLATGNAAATDFNWYANETGGTPIATTATFSPIISASTTYWVTATNGTCESLKRIPVIATLNPVTELTITPETPVVCDDTDIIEISATSGSELAYLIDEDFEGGGTGVFNAYNSNPNSPPAEIALSQWQNRTSTYVPNQQVWFPAISSGFGANQFLMATSDIAPTQFIITTLESPIIDSSTFTDLELSFDMYFSKYSAASDPDDIYIAISTDGGLNYTLLQNIDYDVGIGTNFDNVNIDLSAYLNEPNLRIIIDYVAGWMDGVAIDNIQVFGNRTLNPSFTWTGTVDAYTDAATTIPYVAGTPAASVFIRPTLAQLSMGNFTFTANATLSNGCTINKDITITNNSKIWNGSVSSDWDTAANWTPSGIPTSDNCIYIPNTTIDPIMSNITNGAGLRLTVANGGLFTQQSNSSLTITENVNINSGGTYNILDSSSLIQIDNVTNIVDGAFTMARTTNIRQNDYVYWSSPVTAFSIENISPGTLDGFKYEWIPSAFQGIGPFGNMVFGEWQSADTGTMDIAKGYIIKGPSGHPTTSMAFTATFSGTPNNGTIIQPIDRGAYTGAPFTFQPYVDGDFINITNDDDNWNLIGNPYPSAISSTAFLTANSNITGAVYLWTHGTDIGTGNPDPFYDDYIYNYNVADYLVYNASGPSIQNGFRGNIGAGQGFFVLMTDTASTSETISFENTMRSSTYANNEFYRNSTEPNVNTSRIWLDFISPSGQTNTALVAYINGATNDEDRMFDAVTTTGNGLNLYSILDNKAYLIQGRQLPFDQTDQVSLGLNITESGIQTIAIHGLEGIFSANQDIFIEDLVTGIIHNLKNAPYTFNSEPGIINERFILRYNTNTLSIKDSDSLSGIKVFEDNEKIVVKSDYENIESIEVYDILGRTLFTDKSMNINRFTINSLRPKDTSLFLKIKLVDGKQKITKIIF